MKKIIEEVAKERWFKVTPDTKGIVDCAKYQSEQMYSEEEVIKLLDDYRMQLAYGERVFKTVKDWFNLNKKK